MQVLGGAQGQAREGEPQVELVVARYRESLGWLRKVPPSIRVTVYDKGHGEGGAEHPASILPQEPASRRRARRGGAGGVPWAEVVPLPNVGREAHTYLHHITSRLAGEEAQGSLAQATFFCQGHPFDHACDLHATLRAAASGSLDLGAGGWQWLGHAVDTDSHDGDLFRSWSKNPGGGGLDIRGFHRALLGGEGPEEYRFVLGGQFAAGRSLIEGRGLAFWERALAASTSWPEAAHCFERCWDRVLGARGPDDALMRGRRTVHLKPTRAAQGP